MSGALPNVSRPVPFDRPFGRPFRETPTVSSRIIEDVRTTLFEGGLRPGDFLGSEKDLAERYGVSRVSVRDALRALEVLGIVVIRSGAGGGATIASGTLDRYADALAVHFTLTGVDETEIRDAQRSIEEIGAELAAARATREDLARLERLIDQAAAARDDARAFSQLSVEFHLAVADAASNRALGAQLKALRYVEWRRPATETDPEAAERVLDAHRAIYGRIAAGDGVGARQLMARHLGGGAARAIAQASPESSCC